jgi:large conductance mechanosensitive channel
MVFRGENLVKEEEMLEELKKIRALLEPKPAPPPPKGLWPEFKSFIENYKVLGLAVAFIMGLYLGALVQSLVKDLLLPAIGLAIPGLADLATYTVPVGTQTFGVGSFDNLYNRCLRDLHHSEDNKEVGHTIAG